jgi:hypothetical protein
MLLVQHFVSNIRFAEWEVIRQIASFWSLVPQYLRKLRELEYAPENVAAALALINNDTNTNRIHWQLLGIVDIGIPLCKGIFFCARLTD